MQHEWVWVGRDYVLIDDSERVCGILWVLDDETHYRSIKASQKVVESKHVTERLKRLNKRRSELRRKAKKKAQNVE